MIENNILHLERAKIISVILKLYFITDRDMMYACAHRLIQAGGLTHREIYERMHGMALGTTSHVARMYTHWIEKNARANKNQHILTPEQCTELFPLFEKVFTATTEDQVLAALVTDPFFRDNAFTNAKNALIKDIELSTNGTKDELVAICTAVSAELAKEQSPWVSYFPKKYSFEELFAVFDHPQEIDFDTRYLEIVKLVDSMKRVMYFISQDLATLDNSGFTMKTK